jgi:hypothetical protein
LSISSSFDDYSWKPKGALKDPEYGLCENRVSYATTGDFIQREKFAAVHYPFVPPAYAISKRYERV